MPVPASSPGRPGVAAARCKAVAGPVRARCPPAKPVRGLAGFLGELVADEQIVDDVAHPSLVVKP
jgi:hypothetical protein